MKKLLLFLTALFLVQPAFAQNLSDIWCDTLNDEQQYELANLSNYQTFLQGDDGWVFRSNTGFEDWFFVSEKTRSYMKALQDELRKKGTELVIIYPPPRSMIHHEHVKESDYEALKFDAEKAEQGLKHYAQFLAMMQKDGINIVGLPDPKPEYQMFFKRDHHWTPEGAKAAAEAVADFVKEMPVYEQLEKTEFDTTKGETEEYRGAFKKVFKTLCNTDMPPEPRMRYETQAVTSADTEDALFGNAKDPEVVLLGTSNSSPTSNVANFEGFLKDALDGDVENMAVTGAGIDSSLIAYLNADRATTNPAKLLIWEVPGYYNFDFMRRNVFLQAVPAVQGACEDRALAVNGGFQIMAPDEYALFEGVKDIDLSNGRHYIVLDFDRPIMSKFFLSVEFEVFRDTQPFGRSARYPAPDGRYYFWLDQDERGSPKEIYFKPDDAGMVGAKAKAYLCRLETEH